MIDNLYFKGSNSIKLGLKILPSQNNKVKREVLKRNIIFKNAYKGERCFIVANGPSIKNENLELIRGEKIFTVNQMVRKKEFVGLNPIANFWFDPAYFDDTMPSESIEEFTRLFYSTCTCNDEIVNFVPYYAKNFMVKNKLDFDKVYFLDTSLYFYDNYNKPIDYTKLSPSYQNIVQYAISMAIYMGFTKIYLLGVDSTGIITKINSVLQQSIDGCYTYNLDLQGQKYVNSLLGYFSVEEQFAGWTRIFHLYKELNKYCEKRGIQLVNCSSQTIIEGIPRKTLGSVIYNEQDVKNN